MRRACAAVNTDTAAAPFARRSSGRSVGSQSASRSRTEELAMMAAATIAPGVGDRGLRDHHCTARDRRRAGAEGGRAPVPGTCGARHRGAAPPLPCALPPGDLAAERERLARSPRRRRQRRRGRGAAPRRGRALARHRSEYRGRRAKGRGPVPDGARPTIPRSHGRTCDGAAHGAARAVRGDIDARRRCGSSRSPITRATRSTGTASTT